MEISPRAVFERLFGDGEAPIRWRAWERTQEQRTILDYVRGDSDRLESGPGLARQSKLDEYLESIRDIERRIQKAEEQNATMNLPVMERPCGHSGGLSRSTRS